MSSGHPILKVTEEREGIKKQATEIIKCGQRFPCGEKIIKTRIKKFRKKKERGGYYSVYKVLVENNI